MHHKKKLLTKSFIAIVIKKNSYDIGHMKTVQWILLRIFNDQVMHEKIEGAETQVCDYPILGHKDIVASAEVKASHQDPVEKI